ncbi:MAG: hypothetical protein AAF699_12910 [Pseudomonadota bacterium]
MNNGSKKPVIARLFAVFFALLSGLTTAYVDAPEVTCEEKKCSAPDFKVPPGQTGSIKYTCANPQLPYSIVTCNFKNDNGDSCRSSPSEQYVSAHTCSCKNGEWGARQMQSYVVCYQK